MIYPYVTIDGNNYALASGSYTRNWVRSFTSYLAANIVRLNFIDKGPGVQTYNFQVICAPWGSNTLPYLNGVTVSAEQQMLNLEASYAKVATPIQFITPLGVTEPYGVYMTDLQQTIPKYATSQEAYIIATVELTAATQTLN